MSVYIRNIIYTLSSNTSEFVFTFDNPLKEVISIEVIRSRIPASEYTIEPASSTFRYNSSFITFPTRDYNAGEFCNTLLSLCNDSNLSMTEVTRKGIFKFTNTSSFVMSGGTIHRQLGFKDASTEYTAHDDGTGTGTFVLTAPNRYDLSGTGVVYIWLYETDVLTNEQPGCMYLGEAYLTGLGENIFQQLYDIPSRFFQPIHSLNRISIKFYRDYGRTTLYDFHGIQWYLQVNFKVIDSGRDWSSANNDAVDSSNPQQRNINPVYMMSAGAGIIPSQLQSRTESSESTRGFCSNNVFATKPLPPEPSQIDRLEQILRNQTDILTSLHRTVHVNFQRK
jgi:hypothetical protein